MGPENEWEAGRSTRNVPAISPIRVALVFGFVAVAMAMIATPFLDRQTRTQFAGLNGYGVDMMATGSIDPSKRYTIHKSVLQSSPDAECVIYADGRERGDC